MMHMQWQMGTSAGHSSLPPDQLAFWSRIPQRVTLHPETMLNRHGRENLQKKISSTDFRMVLTQRERHCSTMQGAETAFQVFVFSA